MAEVDNAVGIAKLEGKLDIILGNIARADQSRKDTYSKIDKINQSMLNVDFRLSTLEMNINNRLSTLEANYKTIQPTIKEYNEYKYKISGASIFGRWIWIVAGSLIGIGGVIYNWMQHILGA